MAATAASWKKTAYFAAFVKEEQLGDKGAESAVGCNSLKETAHLAAHVKEEQLGDKGTDSLRVPLAATAERKQLTLQLSLKRSSLETRALRVPLAAAAESAQKK